MAAAQNALHQEEAGDYLMHGLVTDETADCIVQLHCMTGCDANSSFYGKGKKSVYDHVVKSPVAHRSSVVRR